MARFSLTVNGRAHTVDVEPDTPLLYVLRNELDLKGPRFGCGLAQCGACSVIADGRAIRSCITPVTAVQDGSVTTLEALGSVAEPGTLQAAFIEEQAAQCGFCMNGMLINAQVLLDSNPDPSDDDIKRALDPILCRCGSHLRVIRAIKRAAAANRATA